MKILHHPFCTKSKAALELLQKKHIQHEIIDITDPNFSLENLNEAVQKSNLKVEDFVRKNEPFFERNYSGKLLTDNELLELMMNHRQLIQRPILMNDECAIIGRPIEVVLDFIKKIKE